MTPAEELSLHLRQLALQVRELTLHVSELARIAGGATSADYNASTSVQLGNELVSLTASLDRLLSALPQFGE